MPNFDVKAFLQSLPAKPGVYQMLDQHGDVLYVGKARHLKNRVSSYFRQDNAAKTQLMLQHMARIDLTITHSENEALLLESNLIKQLKPRFNVLLRDDKSYPYLYISTHQTFPRMDLFRGTKKNKGRYFGPYPSVAAVRETLNLLQKLFRIRQCKDSFFAHRSRPCLQYQIKRCSAPCVGAIAEQAYADDLRHALLFLEGNDQQVIQELADRMEQASVDLNFEQAAHYRDLIASLRRIQEKQYVSGEQGDVDVIAGFHQQQHACVQVLTVRHGRVLGSKAYFPQVPSAANLDDILNAFIGQYYLNTQHQQNIPKQIISNESLTEKTWLESVLSEQAAYKVRLSHSVKGMRFKWLQMASLSAKQSLQSYLSDKASVQQHFVALQDALQLDNAPTRLECFDISHSMGEATVASCVVFDAQGPLKSDYRRFNIKDITGGDDYAAMRQALSRRYTRLKSDEAKLPDILFIDGGKGQLTQAEQVLEELQVTGVLLVGISKGESRKPGLETLHFVEGPPIQLESSSFALHLIQQIRDEAHRFAITGHRQRRDKARKTSVLEGIPGVGQKRRRDLLRHFGGLAEVKRASVEELHKAPGISLALAERIFATMHTN